MSNDKQGVPSFDKMLKEASERNLDKARNPNEKQVGGDHYKGGIEVWDFITVNRIGYLEGNAIKYISRHPKKNGVEDLKKAIHYIEKLIAVLEDESQQAQVLRNEAEWEAFMGEHNHSAPKPPRLAPEEFTEKVVNNKKDPEESYSYYFPYF